MQTEQMRLRELTVRYSVKKNVDGQPVIVGRALNSPRNSAAALMAVLKDEPPEVVRDALPYDETPRHRLPRGDACGAPAGAHGGGGDHPD